jgi:hypothetical protein
VLLSKEGGVATDGGWRSYRRRTTLIPTVPNNAIDGEDRVRGL